MNHHTCRNIALAVTLLCSRATSAPGQGTFQNLDFENANIVLDTASPYYPYAVAVSNALPGWSVHGGAIPPGQDILYDDVFLSQPSVSIQDVNGVRPDGGGGPVLQGQYSLYLLGGPLGQIGQVPAGSRSLQFYGSASGGYIVTFAGQSIPVAPIGTGPNYAVFGGNISAFAGQTGELLISGGGSLDNIFFSPTTVPEPRTLTITALGLAMLAATVFRRRQ